MAALELVSVGWPMSTPRLNYFREYLWRNPAQFRFVGILFERRLVPALHSIPIIETREIARDTHSDKTFVRLSINLPLLDLCSEALRGIGIETVAPAELIRESFRKREDGRMTSPFAEISAKDIVDLQALPTREVLRRVAGFKSVELVQQLASAWSHYRWDSFYDWTSNDVQDAVVGRWIDLYYAHGVRQFLVGASRSLEFVELITHFGAMHRSSDYRIDVTEFKGTGVRERLQKSVLGERLGSNVSGFTEGLILADGVDEFTEMMARLHGRPSQFSAIVRLRRSLLDLMQLSTFLDDHGTDHQIELDLRSADPSFLYANVFPRYGRPTVQLGS